MSKVSKTIEINIHIKWIQFPLLRHKKTVNKNANGDNSGMDYWKEVEKRKSTERVISSTENITVLEDHWQIENPGSYLGFSER